jgi:hypothetical protein
LRIVGGALDAQERAAGPPLRRGAEAAPQIYRGLRECCQAEPAFRRWLRWRSTSSG